MTQPAVKPVVPPGVKIKTNYVPKARLLKAKQVTQICPRCNQPIPASEMAEHMRIELLDPKWKEQRDKARDKLKDSNLDNNTVSTNLKLLAKTRPDIFGGDEFNIEKTIKAEQQKEAEKRKVIWDGHTASIGTVTQKLGQTANWDEQLAELRREAEEQEAKRDAIGPRVPGPSEAVAAFALPTSASTPAGPHLAAQSHQPYAAYNSHMSAPNMVQSSVPSYSDASYVDPYYGSYGAAYDPYAAQYAWSAYPGYDAYGSYSAAQPYYSDQYPTNEAPSSLGKRGGSPGSASAAKRTRPNA